MAWQAKHRYARISSRKAQLMTALIVGRDVQDALNVLKFMPNRAAGMVSKVLTSAIASADEAEADLNRLVVVEARSNQGPTMKRMHRKDRGRMHPIMKRTSHIMVTVEVE